MRILTNVLVVLAAVFMLTGTVVALIGRGMFVYRLGGLVPYWTPETWWRGAVGMLLFAITFLLMERRQR